MSGGVPVVVILPMGQHPLLNLFISALCSHLEIKTHLSILQQTTIQASIFSISLVSISPFPSLDILFHKSIRKIKQKTRLPCTHLLRDYDTAGILIWRSVARVFQLGGLQRIRNKSFYHMIVKRFKKYHRWPDNAYKLLGEILSLLPVW